jgi:hypothetical protein
MNIFMTLGPYDVSHVHDGYRDAAPAEISASSKSPFPRNKPSVTADHNRVEKPQFFYAVSQRWNVAKIFTIAIANPNFAYRPFKHNYPPKNPRVPVTIP